LCFIIFLYFWGRLLTKTKNVMQNDKNTIAEFEEIYLSFYPRLKRFAQEYVIREADAENIVQDVFLDLWERRAFVSSSINLTSYLFTNIKNKCIDFLRHRMVMQNAANKMQEEYELALQMKFQSLQAFDEHIFSNADMEAVIADAIQSLPEKCRRIFVMNKIEGKKQKTIAEELDISIHTVESQMAIAYRKLKEILKDYQPLFIFLFI
jgi:RNA polymerase sigma-70 factor (family 1)